MYSASAQSFTYRKSLQMHKIYTGAQKKAIISFQIKLLKGSKLAKYLLFVMLLNQNR